MINVEIAFIMYLYSALYYLIRSVYSRLSVWLQPRYSNHLHNTEQCPFPSSDKFVESITRHASMWTHVNPLNIPKRNQECTSCFVPPISWTWTHQHSIQYTIWTSYRCCHLSELNKKIMSRKQLPVGTLTSVLLTDAMDGVLVQYKTIEHNLCSWDSRSLG